jgi:hypothetical protein
MKEKPRRRLRHLLNEISTDQLGNRVVLRWRMEMRYSAAPPLSTQADGQIFKGDVNGFSSISDICFRTDLEHYIVYKWTVTEALWIIDVI